jgi:hypothetical protein
MICERSSKSDNLCASHLRRLIRQRAKGIPDNGKALFYTEKEMLKFRFDKKWKLSESGCWLWTGTTRKPSKKYVYRYGVIRVKHGARGCGVPSEFMRAYKVSWMLHCSDIPAGAHVLHKCNNPMCVNPDHLYLGDHKTNMRDMALSGRHGKLKVTNAQALEIRASKEPTKVLCERYGLERSTVKGIRNGKARNHLTSEVPAETA